MFGLTKASTPEAPLRLTAPSATLEPVPCLLSPEHAADLLAQTEAQLQAAAIRGDVQSVARLYGEYHAALLTLAGLGDCSGAAVAGAVAGIYLAAECGDAALAR